jgi:hypothetical protein
MRWEQGRTAIERMLADGELQRVPSSREQSERLLAQARVHVASALKVCDEDPPGGYALACDGARKALTAILENEGLRPTTRGGHLAVLEASGRNLIPRWDVSSASSTGCVSAGTTQSTRQQTRPRSPPADVREDQTTAESLIDIATRLLDEMSRF